MEYNQNTGRKPASRRRKSKSNKYLYIAVVLLVIALAIGVILVAALQADGDESSLSSEATTSYAESSVASESSVEPSSEAESSEDTSDDTSMIMTPSESIKAYEDKVGVKYAIDMLDYEKFVCPDDEEKYVFLVTPEHTLGADYVPEGLVKCSSIRAGRPDYFSQMVDVADNALLALLAEAAEYGFDDITVTNAYRSYATQARLFNDYCAKEWATGKFSTKEEAEAYVLTYSTRPGTSEHQSGLCCDMHNVSVSSPRTFNNTPAAKWLENNSYRFGFILRYPEGKTDITGIIYESWHFRYVGRTAATEIYQSGLTLDEYLANRP